MTVFDRLAANSNQVFMRLGGEPFVIRPMTAARGARTLAQTDAARGANVAACGVFMLEARVAGRASVLEAEETARKPGGQSDRWVLSLPASALPWLPRVGDIVTRTSSGQILRVASDAAQDETWLRIVLSG